MVARTGAGPPVSETRLIVRPRAVRAKKYPKKAPSTFAKQMSPKVAPTSRKRALSWPGVEVWEVLHTVAVAEAASCDVKYKLPVDRIIPVGLRREISFGDGTAAGRTSPTNECP